MKKLAIIFGVVLVVIASGFAIRAMNYEVLIHRKQIFVEGTEKPLNGEKSFHDFFGNLRTEAKYVNGYPEHITSYYPSGEKRHVFIYEEDEMQSITSWYKSGQMKYESKGNIIREWYENGQLKVEAHYADERKTLHGITKVWYEEGTLKGRENYNNGKLDGERVKWDEKGNKVLTQVYKEGELVES